MKDDCEWLNFRWGLDISYTHIENAPILASLIKKYKRFWDGEYFYVVQARKFILRYPDWRKNYRVDLEKVRVRADPIQRKLLEVERGMETTK
jgi:hypothetical protein